MTEQRAFQAAERRVAHAIATLCLIALYAVVPRHALAGAQQLLSTRDPAVAQPAVGNGDSVAPIVTPDGRFVLFVSSANNLVQGDNNQLGTDLFLRDRLLGITTLVSANVSGTGGGNGNSGPGAMTPDGRFVVFESSSSDLVSGDTNNTNDIFIRDMIAGGPILVSVSTSGGSANGISSDAVMTPDGRFVAFVSVASNLVSGDTNGISDIFVRDLLAGTTTLVSVGAVKISNVGISATPVISTDGRFVAFYSSADGLIAGTTTQYGHIFLRDLVAGATSLVSADLSTSPAQISSHPKMNDDGRFVVFRYGPVGSLPQIRLYDSVSLSSSIINSNASSAQPTALPPMFAVDDVLGPEMTADGRFVAFVAPPFIGTTNSVVLVFDNLTLTNILVSQEQGGSYSSNASDTPVISPDGRFVTFVSNGTNLVTNTVSAGFHVYRRDLLSGTTHLVDVDTNCAGSRDLFATIPSMSSDGQIVAFTSRDGSFVAGDNNNAYDVFLRDFESGTTELISARDTGVISQSGTGMSSMTQTSLSPDGRWLVYVSRAADLVTNDFNNDQDVFVKDLLTGSNVLVSAGTNGYSATNGWSGSPVMSGDGRYVAFVSGASNLTSVFATNAYNIYLRDLVAGTTLTANLDSNGAPLGNGDSLSPAISQDGRYIVFISKTNFLASFPNVGLYRRDNLTGEVVALNSNVTAGQSPSMTADGRYIAYLDNNGPQLCVFDTQASANITSNLVSAATTFAITPAGSRLAYQHPGGISPQIVVKGFPSNNTLYSFTGSGIGSVAPVRSAAQWSADGRFFAFTTSNNAVVADNNGSNDVYLYDLQTASLTLVSVNSNLTASGSGSSDMPALSGDGHFVVFRSFAADIAPGVTNRPGIFMYDRFTASNTLLTPESGSSWSYWASKPSASIDGRTIVFQSFRPGLAPGILDFNRSLDLFAVTTDSDVDGIPDAWTQHYFGHPTGQAGDLSRPGDDADGDGMTNLQEYLAGTQPTSAASVLSVQISPAVSGNAVLTWQAAPGKTYRVHYKDVLTDAVWLELPGNPVVVGSQASFTVNSNTAGRFYRVVTVN